MRLSLLSVYLYTVFARQFVCLPYKQCNLTGVILIQMNAKRERENGARCGSIVAYLINNLIHIFVIYNTMFVYQFLFYFRFVARFISSHALRMILLPFLEREMAIIIMHMVRASQLSDALRTLQIYANTCIQLQMRQAFDLFIYRHLMNACKLCVYYIKLNWNKEQKNKRRRQIFDGYDMYAHTHSLCNNM